MRIKELKIKNDAIIELGNFSVLVGPNNVGKSQTLRDIHLKLMNGKKEKTTIVTDVLLDRPTSFVDLLVGLKVLDHPTNVGMHQIRGISPNLRGGETINVNLEDLERRFENQDNIDFIFGNLSKFRVSYLDAGSRLSVASSTESFNPHTEPPQNLLQGLFGADKEEELKLRDIFKRTFNIDILLDYSGMRQLSLRLAEKFPEIPDDPRDAYPIFNKFSRLDDQGDGFRSFVGVVLSILLSKGRVVLLDEPEAFLHPAQARQLGFWIAEQSRTTKGQIIVATHNAHFLAGILSSKQSIDIFRLNRQDDITTYNLISSEATSNLAKSPLLSSQRVLDAIFYKGVVVCEADADRAIYQTVAVRKHDDQSVLFIHAHNKQTIPRVVSLLKSACIPVCAIVDLDILNSSDNFKKLLNSLNGSPDLENLLALRNDIALRVEGADEKSFLDKMIKLLGEFLGQLQRGEHNLSGGRGALGRIRQDTSKWSSVKKDGISGFPQEAQKNTSDLVAEVKDIGLFLVPVGELEGWIDLGTKKKNRWIILALESLHDDQCPENLAQFVKEILDNLD